MNNRFVMNESDMRRLIIEATIADMQFMSLEQLELLLVNVELEIQYREENGLLGDKND